MRYNTCTKGRPARAASWALRIFDAATICIALVICAVLLMDRIRRRKSRGLFINQNDQDDSEKNAGSSPGLFELVGCRLHLGCQVQAQRLFSSDPVEQLRLSRTQEFRQLGLELFDSFDWHIIHITVLNRPDQGHLSLDSDWAV